MSKQDTKYLCIKTFTFKGAQVLKGKTAFTKGNTYHGHVDLLLRGGIELMDDFKAESDKTILQRLQEIEGLSKITVVDQLAADEIVIYQPTSDVIQWAVGEEVQTVQWDVYGGMQVAFKVLGIQVPIVKSTASGQSGVYHLT